MKTLHRVWNTKKGLKVRCGFCTSTVTVDDHALDDGELPPGWWVMAIDKNFGMCDSAAVAVCPKHSKRIRVAVLKKSRGR